MVATFRNQDKKVAFIRVDEYGALERYSEFVRTCHNINIIVQTIGGDESSLNCNRKITNKTLYNIIRVLLTNSSHKKKLWCLPYQYDILISRRTENILHVDVTYFLRNGLRPLYKQIKIWGERFYIINGSVTRKNLDDISHRVYFMGLASTKRVIINSNLYQPFYIHR